MVLKEDGIIKQARIAKEMTEKESIKEQLELAVLASRLNGESTEIDKTILKNELDNLKTNSVIDEYTQGTEETVNLPCTVKKGDYVFEIDENGNVTIKGEYESGSGSGDDNEDVDDPEKEQEVIKQAKFQVLIQLNILQ